MLYSLHLLTVLYIKLLKKKNLVRSVSSLNLPDTLVQEENSTQDRLNVKSKGIQLFECNAGIYFQKFIIGIHFLDETQKEQTKGKEK